MVRRAAAVKNRYRDVDSDEDLDEEDQEYYNTPTKKNKSPNAAKKSPGVGRAGYRDDYDEEEQQSEEVDDYSDDDYGSKKKKKPSVTTINTLLKGF